MNTIKITVRQLKVGDMLTATGLVVVGITDNLQRANGLVGINCLTQAGGHVTQVYSPNAIVNIMRDFDDPTNNPYYWALEALKEREDDEAVYRHEMEQEEQHEWR